MLGRLRRMVGSLPDNPGVDQHFAGNRHIRKGSAAGYRGPRNRRRARSAAGFAFHTHLFNREALGNPPLQQLHPARFTVRRRSGVPGDPVLSQTLGGRHDGPTRRGPSAVGGRLSGGSRHPLSLMSRCGRRPATMLTHTAVSWWLLARAKPRSRRNASSMSMRARAASMPLACSMATRLWSACWR